MSAVEGVTVDLVDVYDGEELPPRTVQIEHLPPAGCDGDALEEWAQEHIWPLTGTGQRHETSGHFATITACAAAPSLIGREFEWIG